MKIYVAGKWTAQEEIRDRIEQVRRLGHEITHNWTTNDPGNIRGGAIEDIKGVQNSDLVIAVMNDPKYPYRGTFCEIGCALGLGKPVIIYSPEPEISDFYQVCFAHHPKVEIITSWNDILNGLTC